MKKLAFFALIAAGSLTFQSCNSDDDNGGGNPATNLLPAKFIYTGDENGFEEYEYDNNRNLVKIVSTLDASIHRYNFSYLNNKLSKVVEDAPGTQDDYEYIINYEGAETIKIEQKQNNSVLTTDYIKINADGTLKSNLDGVVFTYTDGNLTRIIDDLGEVTTFSYFTNEESLYKNINTASWVFSYFQIFPSAKNKNQLKTVSDDDNVTTTFNYSDYSTGNLFPKTLNYTSTDGRSGKITISYQ